MRIGSEEHKQLFCQTFLDTYVPFEAQDLPWPELDALSLARLRAIPIWTMALDTEINAGAMLAGFAATETDPLVRRALELQGYEEDRHGRVLAHMVARYGLSATPGEARHEPTRAAFVHFGYSECVDSFAGFGIFRLACEARILPESLTSIFTRVLVEEARHIVFFVNWIAWDRARRGYASPLLQAVPALLAYAKAIAARVKGGAAMSGEGQATGRGLFDDVLSNLTPAKFLRACIDENRRYMRDFDPRLLRPRLIPSLATGALALVNLIDRLRAAVRGGPATQPQ